MNRPSHQPLFRTLAVEAASGTQIGDPINFSWRGVAVFTVTSFVLVAALLLFASLVEYSAVHRVRAYTDALGGVIRLRAPADGMVVTRIVAPEGSIVRQGELVALLGSDRYRSDGGSQRLLQQGKLNEEQAAILKEIDAAREEAAAQQAVNNRRIGGLLAEREALRADLEAAERLQASLTEQSSQYAVLASQGFVSQALASQKRDEVTSQVSRRAAAKVALTRVDRDIATTRAEQRLLEAKLSGLTANRLRSNGELERQKLLGDIEAERALQAPVTGIVSGALIAEGQSLIQGQAMFTITPQGQPMVLRLLISGKAAAAVQAGMEVKYSLDAYPREKFGLFAARIESVGNAPTIQGDLAGEGAQAELVYVATARMISVPSGPMGQPFGLKPGMSGEVLVPTERRTILEWLLQPFIGGFSQNAAKHR